MTIIETEIPAHVEQLLDVHNTLWDALSDSHASLKLNYKGIEYDIYKPEIHESIEKFFIHLDHKMYEMKNKKQFENDETNFQTKFKNDIKKQAEELKKYDNDISQTSTTIGNQINEYVVLRKHRELMPTNSQVMY